MNTVVFPRLMVSYVITFPQLDRCSHFLHIQLHDPMPRILRLISWMQILRHTLQFSFDALHRPTAPQPQRRRGIYLSLKRTTNSF